jgi:hypothetical protein
VKRWAIFTVLLYALALIFLTLPILFLAFGVGAKNGHNIALRDMLDIYLNWGYWLWLAVMVGGQFLLLLLPISIAEKRLPARRPLKTPVIVGAFLLANLVFAGIILVLCAVYGENIPGYYDLSGSNYNSSAGVILTLIIPLLFFWLVWSIVFRHYSRKDEPNALLKRITRWLLRGSILELLVAVPSHVIVRRREDCCAPIGTFWGIVTGISVMLLCFGPGVYFLFVERFGKLKAKEK